jgi:phosphoglycerate dehydrogenase-like enzyme
MGKAASMNPQPRILVLPRPSLYRRLFCDSTDARLRSLAKVDFNADERELSSVELASRIPDYDVVVTGWGSPRFTDAVLPNAKRLKLVVHSAGSIKFMFDEHALNRGFAISTVAVAMAPAVAEMNLLLVLMCLRGTHDLDRRMKAGEDWKAIKSTGSGTELIGNRVGVIGAGFVGREFIRLLKGLNVEVLVFDPYLPDATATELGVKKAPTLDELLVSSPIVCLHAPATPETRHMIGRRQLGLLRDGAIFINTARSWLTDEEALLAEFKSGRIRGAIDVFDAEPLPADHPFRKLDNVIVTPHVASATRNCHHRQGATSVDEIERFLKGESLRYAVTKQQYSMMA